MERANGTASLAASGSARANPLLQNWQTVAVVIVVLLALAAPFFISNYRMFQFTLAFIYAIALLGLNMLTGYNGQFSLGHGAFYAIGAYTAAILMDKLNLPYPLTLPAAAIVCGVVGFLFGIPALRLEGLYLALATFALGLAVPQLLKYKYIEDYTGGVQGIYLLKPNAPFGLPLNPDQWLYLFCLGVLLLMFLAGRNLLKGRVGRAIVAIRDHHIAAETMGIDIARYKSITFGVSALYTGVAGALSAIVIQFVAPDSFNIFLSISFLVGVVVGGLASISGAILGGIFIQFIPNISESVSKAAPWAIYGIFLILCMYLMPGGVVGLVRMAAYRLRMRRNQRASA